MTHLWHSIAGHIPLTPIMLLYIQINSHLQFSGMALLFFRSIICVKNWMCSFELLPWSSYLYRHWTDMYKRLVIYQLETLVSIDLLFFYYIRQDFKSLSQFLKVLLPVNAAPVTRRIVDFRRKPTLGWNRKSFIYFRTENV